MFLFYGILIQNSLISIQFINSSSLNRKSFHIDCGIFIPFNTKSFYLWTIGAPFVVKFLIPNQRRIKVWSFFSLIQIFSLHEFPYSSSCGLPEKCNFEQSWKNKHSIITIPKLHKKKNKLAVEAIFKKWYFAKIWILYLLLEP